jgi:hypothetical protein
MTVIVLAMMLDGSTRGCDEGMETIEPFKATNSDHLVCTL